MARGFAFIEGVPELTLAQAEMGVFDESWITEELQSRLMPLASISQVIELTK
jgi:hypothetical protein